MNVKYTLAIVGLGLVLAAGRAHAEGEGNGDPFPFRAPGETFVMGQASMEPVGALPGVQTAVRKADVSPGGSEEAGTAERAQVAEHTTQRSSVASK